MPPVAPPFRPLLPASPHEHKRPESLLLFPLLFPFPTPPSLHQETLCILFGPAYLRPLLPVEPLRPHPPTALFPVKPVRSLTKEPATNSAQSYRSQSDKLFQSIRTESLTLAAETNVEPGGLVFLCQSARVFVFLIPGQFFIPRGPDPESTVLEIWPTVRGTGQASCDRLVCSVLTHTPRSSASFFLREWISHLRHGDLGNRHQNPSGTTQCQLEGLIDRLSTIYPVPVLFMPPRLVLLETAAFQAGGRAL